MAAHRKLNRLRDDLCVAGLRNCALISVTILPTPPRDVYDQSEDRCDQDCLQHKLLSVDVAGHDEERSVGIAHKPEKTASAMRRKRQREHDGKKDG